jgi:hypothetical protein
MATLSPQPGPATESHWCLVCGSLGGVSSILNLLLFLPLGIGLAIYRFGAKRAVVLMCVLAILIETAQLLFIPGRNATIGDVLANSLGGAIGFAIARNAFILLRPTQQSAMALTLGWSIGWLAIQTVSAFGFTIALPRSVYYGQLAGQPYDSRPFSASVVQARIADVAVPDTKLYDSRKVRGLVISGATVTTTILPESAHEIGPIVRIADDSQREILVVGQNTTDMVFGVRTGAALIRLRPTLFVLPDGFAGVQSGSRRTVLNTLTLSAAYSAHEVWMNVQSGVTHGRRIRITPSLAWTMLLPFQWYIEGTRTERLLSAIWTGCLLLPLGYWASATSRSQRRGIERFQLTVVSLALLFVCAGLVLVPRAFGVTPAPFSDWIAALTGLLSGAGVSRREPAPDSIVVLSD